MMNSLVSLGSLLITARKRSLGQGNIFTPVCHSVHRGVLSQHALQVVSQHALQGELSQHALQVASQHALQGGGLLLGGCLIWEGLLLGVPVLMGGGAWWIPPGLLWVVCILLECILVVNCR